MAYAGHALGFDECPVFPESILSILDCDVVEPGPEGDCGAGPRQVP